ncbi:hypothetical protein KP78_21830 [Jeotgalibacillus soli]|uniref:L-lysine N6-monooxygenase MbtG n=1 Tax=Jeotgalibacillus soli TaxID=889306 RepID=A0A0C2RVP1_9BACL|nr:hypothetical protein KP78_21830 [Jeotgalibacillus soli]
MNMIDLIRIEPYHFQMAAAIQEADAFDAVFFEQENTFESYPGMLIDGTNLQVSFLADLVSYANPKSHFYSSTICMNTFDYINFSLLRNLKCLEKSIIIMLHGL